MHRKQHFAGSKEYISYKNALSQGVSLWHEGSVKFSGWRQCVELGLMVLGRWF
jgi:hypothetical protein